MRIIKVKRAPPMYGLAYPLSEVMGILEQKQLEFRGVSGTRGLASLTRLAYLRVWKLLAGFWALAGVVLKDVTPELARTLRATWTLGKGPLTIKDYQSELLEELPPSSEEFPSKELL